MRPVTTDDFTEAARVEALRAWVKESDRMDSIGTLGAHMAEWARTHLAQQATARAHKTKACPTCHGDVHVDLAGDIWTTSNAPTDAEVEAAARGLHAALEAVHGTAWDDLGKAHRNRWYDLARAALTAASAARRGESDDSNHKG